MFNINTTTSINTSTPIYTSQPDHYCHLHHHHLIHHPLPTCINNTFFPVHWQIKLESRSLFFIVSVTIDFVGINLLDLQRMIHWKHWPESRMEYLHWKQYFHKWSLGSRSIRFELRTPLTKMIGCQIWCTDTLLTHVIHQNSFTPLLPSTIYYAFFFLLLSLLFQTLFL